MQPVFRSRVFRTFIFIAEVIFLWLGQYCASWSSTKCLGSFACLAPSQDPLLVSKLLKLRVAECGDRLKKFIADEGVNKVTGEIDWLRAGPYRMEFEDVATPTLVTSIEYITGGQSVMRGTNSGHI